MIAFFALLTNYCLTFAESDLKYFGEHRSFEDKILFRASKANETKMSVNQIHDTQ